MSTEPRREEAAVPVEGGPVDDEQCTEADQEKHTSRRGRWIALAAVVAAVLVLAVGGYWNVRPGPLEAAYDDCDFDAGSGVRVADGGSTLLVRTVGEENPIGIDYFDLPCVYRALDMPERVTNQIGSTRALDGRVSDSWDDFTATWSYHPDSGLDLMITTE